MRLYEFTDPSEYLLPETDPAESPSRSKRNPPPDVSDETVASFATKSRDQENQTLGYAMRSKSALVGSEIGGNHRRVRHRAYHLSTS
jgi:hypothetical protein